MNVDKLYDIVEDFFGYKAKILYYNSGKNEVGCSLYNSFLFKCDLNDRYGVFSAAIVVGQPEANITDFLGERCSLDSDEGSIRKSLEIVDNYCRLRLPDKFLKEFEKVYK